MTNKRPHVTPTERYSITEVAQILEVDRSTIYRWIEIRYLRPKRRRVNNRLFVLGSEILRVFDAYE